MKVSGYIIEEGKAPRCPIEICGAICCMSSSFRPDRKGPCEYLTKELSCELHKIGGPRCKPLGCHEYPRSQADIDAINKLAKDLGFTQRCQLNIT